MSVVKRSPLEAVTDDDDPLMRAFAGSPPLSPSPHLVQSTPPVNSPLTASSAFSSSTSSPLTTPAATYTPPSSSTYTPPSSTYTPPTSTSLAGSSAPTAASAARSVAASGLSSAKGFFNSLGGRRTSANTAPSNLFSSVTPTPSTSSLPPSSFSSSSAASTAEDMIADAERRRREREGTVRPNSVTSVSSFSSTPNPLTPAHNGSHMPLALPTDVPSTSTPPTPAHSSTPVLLPYQDYTLVDDELMMDYVDDWDSHGDVPGEKLVMKIECVFYYRDADSVATNTPMQSQQVAAKRWVYDPLSQPLATNSGAPQQPSSYTPPTAVSHADDKSTVIGTLVMTSYQLYLEPLSSPAERLSKHVIDGVIAMPLSTIEKLVKEPPRGQLHILDLYGKDGRVIRFGFGSETFAKRAFDCLNMYVFPNDDSLLFAFYYKPKVPVPSHLNGWNLYNPVSEFRRLGIPNKALRLCVSNKDYHLSTSYPALFVLPAEQYFTDQDLESVAKFRSRGRVPACTWQHPTGRQTIWRCSQPRVGVRDARNVQDEKLIMAISIATGIKDIAIFDCRPRMNAQANRLAGKGFESADNYRNCKIFFMNIENIHAMRSSYQRLIKACQQDVHSADFQNAVASSMWLAHVGMVLKATYQMVLSIDRDKLSILSHCSDGWDRTSQLVSLTEICLDAYYRTMEGFCVLVEKDWVSFGHQFAKRTGHREDKADDQQRSPIFLQWCDCVWQLTQQFPHHFEFNSHFLVTVVSHLYSCRFGTFFLNTEMMRKKTKLANKTVSLWTYMMCSPAACRGEFTNPLYAPSGTGSGDAIMDWGVFKQADKVYERLNRSHMPHLVDGTAPAGEVQALRAIAEKGDSAPTSNGEANGTEVVNAPSDASAPAGITTAASPDAEEPKSTSDPAQSASGQESQPPPVDGESKQAEEESKESAAASSSSLAPPATPTPARSGSVSASDEPPSPRKTSVGRGGGDGSHKTYAGAVLYPSWSGKKLQLWSDYFLRYHGDQAEHVSAFGPLGPGGVPPGGVATTHFLPNDGLWQKTVRKMAEEKSTLEEQALDKEERLRRAEAEVAQLRAKLQKAGLPADVEVKVERLARKSRKGPRPVRVGDVSREENALLEDEPDLTNVQEELDNPEDKAADV